MSEAPEADRPRWQLLKSIFAEAAELDDPNAREAFIQRACAGDTDLLSQARRMLAIHDESNLVVDRAPFGAIPLGSLASGSFAEGRVVAGRFSIVRRLGTGGMGEVYEAADTALGGTRLALKTIRADHASQPAYIDRFKQELQLLRQITHANVCRVFDFFPGDGAGTPAFFTMELIEGETLTARVERTGPLPPAEAAGIFRQVLQGLEAAHTAGVIHRDLKPSNIMLTASRAVLMDFGIAHGSHAGSTGETTLTQGALIGTPTYMAPEQLQGRPVSPAADLYAFGVVAYQALTGLTPFGTSSPMAVVARKLTSDPATLVDQATAIPIPWRRVIGKCLAHEPGERYASAGEVSEALGKRRHFSWPRRPRGVWWPVAAVAALVVMAGLWWTLRTPALPEPVARMYTEGLNALADGSYLKANRLLEQTAREAPYDVPATLRLAETYLELDQIRKAQEALLRISDRWILSTDTRYLREALRLLLLRDYDAAIPILKRREITTQSQLDLGRALEKANRLEESQQAYEQVLNRDPGHAGALLRLATVAAAKLERPSAETYLQQAEAAYGRFGNAEGQGEVDLARASLAKDLNQFDVARGFAQAGQERGRQTSSPWLEIRGQLVQAAIEVLDAKPDDASEKAAAAIARAREAGLETLACQGLIDLGIAHLTQVQDKRAEQVHREALAIAERNDSPFYAASARLGLAMDLSGQLRGTESLAMAQQAHAYFMRTSFRLKQVESLRVLGHAYIALNDWDHASHFYGAAAALASQPWEVRLRLRNLESQANVEMRRGNYPQARTAALAMLQAATKGNLPPLITIAQARLTLANVARLLGHYPEARRRTEELLHDPASENVGFREQVLGGQVALLAAEGKTAEAVALAEAVIAAAGRQGRAANRADMEIRRCWILAEDPASDPRLVIRDCQAVLATMSNRATQGAADVEQALAEAYWRKGEWSAAQSANEAAMAFYQAKGRVHEVFYCRLLEAAIHLAGRRAVDAAASRTAASAAFRTMTAGWPLDDQRSYLTRPAVSRMMQRANWTAEIKE